VTARGLNEYRGAAFPMDATGSRSHVHRPREGHWSVEALVLVGRGKDDHSSSGPARKTRGSGALDAEHRVRPER